MARETLKLACQEPLEAAEAGDVPTENGAICCILMLKSGAVKIRIARNKVNCE